MGAKADKKLGQPEPPPTSESPQAGGVFSHAKNKLEKDIQCCGRMCCNCWNHCCIKILLVILTVIVIVHALGVAVNALMMAQAITSYDPDNLGRAVAMIVLIISICCSIAAALYVTTAAFKSQSKNVKIAGIVLAVLALLQLLIALLSGVPTKNEDQSLTRALQESFNKALNHNPKAVEQWAVTQNSLSCCGINSPEDYRQPLTPPFFPPDVPISCCPSYKPSRSPLVQEKERAVCKERKQYYETGCLKVVLPVFNGTSVFLASLTVVLMIFQLALSVLALWFALVIGGKNKKSTKLRAGTELENTEAGLNPKP